MVNETWQIIFNQEVWLQYIFLFSKAVGKLKRYTVFTTRWKNYDSQVRDLLFKTYWKLSVRFISRLQREIDCKVKYFIVSNPTIVDNHQFVTLPAPKSVHTIGWGCFNIDKIWSHLRRHDNFSLWKRSILNLHQTIQWSNRMPTCVTETGVYVHYMDK